MKDIRLEMRSNLLDGFVENFCPPENPTKRSIRDAQLIVMQNINPITLKSMWHNFQLNN